MLCVFAKFHVFSMCFGKKKAIDFHSSNLKFKFFIPLLKGGFVQNSLSHLIFEPEIAIALWELFRYSFCGLSTPPPWNRSCHGSVICIKNRPLTDPECLYR